MPVEPVPPNPPNPPQRGASEVDKKVYKLQLKIYKLQWFLNLITALVLGLMLLGYGLWEGKRYTRSYVDSRINTYDSTVMQGVVLPLFDTIINQQHIIIKQLNERNTEQDIN